MAGSWVGNVPAGAGAFKVEERRCQIGPRVLQESVGRDVKTGRNEGGTKVAHACAP